MRTHANSSLFETRITESWSLFDTSLQATVGTTIEAGDLRDSERYTPILQMAESFKGLLPLPGSFLECATARRTG